MPPWSCDEQRDFYDPSVHRSYNEPYPPMSPPRLPHRMPQVSWEPYCVYCESRGHVVENCIARMIHEGDFDRPNQVNFSNSFMSSPHFDPPEKALQDEIRELKFLINIEREEERKRRYEACFESHIEASPSPSHHMPTPRVLEKPSQFYFAPTCNICESRYHEDSKCPRSKARAEEFLSKFSQEEIESMREEGKQLVEQHRLLKEMHEKSKNQMSNETNTLEMEPLFVEVSPTLATSTSNGDREELNDKEVDEEIVVELPQMPRHDISSSSTSHFHALDYASSSCSLMPIDSHDKSQSCALIVNDSCVPSHSSLYVSLNASMSPTSCANFGNNDSLEFNEVSENQLLPKEDIVCESVDCASPSIDCPIACSTSLENDLNALESYDAPLTMFEGSDMIEIPKEFEEIKSIGEQLLQDSTQGDDECCNKLEANDAQDQKERERGRGTYSVW